MNLTGKRIVVIGASSGMGLAAAARLCNAGAHMVLVGRSQARLEHAASSILRDGAGERISLVVSDMMVGADRQRLVDAAGPVDHVVVTAADLAYSPFKKFSEAAVEKVIRSKLIAPFFLAQAFAESIAKNGSITFVSGIAAERPIPGGTLTGAVNGGLNALVRGLALELAPIRVNTVSPGWVETPIWEEVMPDAARREAVFQAMREKIPVRRIGRPDDVAQAIEAVINNGFMSGSNLYVDGGQRLV